MQGQYRNKFPLVTPHLDVKRKNIMAHFFTPANNSCKEVFLSAKGFIKHTGDKKIATKTASKYCERKATSNDNFLNTTLFWINPSLRRQKCEYQNGSYKKAKHVKFSEKQTFLFFNVLGKTWGAIIFHCFQLPRRKFSILHNGKT